MNSPSRVRAYPYVWYGEGEYQELCIAITGANGRRIIIPAQQLRQIADQCHDRADEAQMPHTTQENTTMTTFTEEQYDKLMIRAMTEQRRANDAEARSEQHVARIGYLEHLLSIREEQLEQLRDGMKAAH